MSLHINVLMLGMDNESLPYMHCTVDVSKDRKQHLSMKVLSFCTFFILKMI